MHTAAPPVRSAAIAAGLMLLLALPVVLLVGIHGWDGLYGQDAFFYHAYATGELREALLGGRAPGPFTWPPGYPVAVALASLATGPATLAGQLVSLGAAASVPVITWLLARDLLPDRPAWVPLLAGLAVALSPHLWQSGAVIMSDTTALASLTLGAWAMVRWNGGGDRRWLVLAAAAIAFAAVTRWAAVVPGAVLAITALWMAWHRRRDAAWGGALRELGPAVLAAALVLAPVVGPMAWAAARTESVPFSLALGSHGWRADNLWATTVTTSDGTLRHPLPMLTFFALEPLRPYHLGPILGGLAIVGMVVTVMRRRSLPIALLVVWPVVTLLALAGDGYQNTRFALLVLPPVAIAAAIGVALAMEAAARAGRRWQGPLRIAAAGVVGAILVVHAVSAWRFTEDFVVRFTEDRSAVASLAARVPSGETLLSFGPTLALRHAGRSVTELSDVSESQAADLAAGAARSWLIVPRDAPGDQWRESAVGATLSRLLGDAATRLVAQAGGWALWATDAA